MHRCVCVVFYSQIFKYFICEQYLFSKLKYYQEVKIIFVSIGYMYSWKREIMLNIIKYMVKC